jgi:hypothetical protein
MSELVMNKNKKHNGGGADDRYPSEMHRRQRGKNIALGLVLFGFVVLFYVVAIVKIGGS